MVRNPPPIYLGLGNVNSLPQNYFPFFFVIILQTPANSVWWGMNITDLELEILSLHNGLSFRPTLDKIRRIGELLTEAKRKIAKREWPTWVRKLGIHPRNDQIYRQVAKEAKTNPDSFSGHLTLQAFLRTIRQAKAAGRKTEMEERRRAAIRANPPLDTDYQVHHADCRSFPWPRLT